MRRVGVWFWRRRMLEAGVPMARRCACRVIKEMKAKGKEATK